MNASPPQTRKHLSFKKGEVIFEKGAVEKHAFLVEEGAVEIFDNDEDPTRTVSIIPKGSFFGEMALLSEGRRLYGARAHDNCVCFVIEESYMQREIEKSPKFVQALIRILVRMVQKQG